MGLLDFLGSEAFVFIGAESFGFRTAGAQIEAYSFIRVLRITVQRPANDEKQCRESPGISDSSLATGGMKKCLRPRLPRSDFALKTNTAQSLAVSKAYEAHHSPAISRRFHSRPGGGFAQFAHAYDAGVVEPACDFRPTKETPPVVGAGERADDENLDCSNVAQCAVDGAPHAAYAATANLLQ
jgi:hypothetical protein